MCLVIRVHTELDFVILIEFVYKDIIIVITGKFQLVDCNVCIPSFLTGIGTFLLSNEFSWLITLRKETSLVL